MKEPLRWAYSSELILSCLTLVVMIMLISFTLQNFRSSNKSTNTYTRCVDCCKNKPAMVASATMIASLLYLGYEIFYVYINFIHLDPDLHQLPLISISYSVLGLQTNLFYTSLIMRVYVLFDNHLSKSVLCCLLTIMLLVFAAWALLSVSFEQFNLHKNDIFGFETITDKVLIFMVIIIFDFIINVIILRIFLKKLYRMIKNLDNLFEALIIQSMEKTSSHSMLSNNDVDYNYNDNHNYDKKNEIEMIELQRFESSREKLIDNREEQNDMIELMTKISILTIFSQIFQHTWYWMYAVYLFGFSDYSWYSNDIKGKIGGRLSMMIRIIRAFAIMFDCLALYLTFAFNNKIYKKCCTICHSSTKNCCIWCIVRNTFQNR